MKNITHFFLTSLAICLAFAANVDHARAQKIALAATISVSPDTGRAGTTLPVTITGQGTHFVPSSNASLLSIYNNVSVEQNGVFASGAIAHPVSLDSSQHYRVDIDFNDTVTPGQYNIRVRSDSSTPKDLYAKIYVLPRPILRISPDSAHEYDTVNTTISTIGGHFTENQSIKVISSKDISLNGNFGAVHPLDYSVLNDSTLLATFVFPQYSEGLYSLTVVEPVSRVTLTTRNAFKVLSALQVIDSIRPHTIPRGLTQQTAIFFRLTKPSTSSGTFYLKRGTDSIPGTLSFDGGQYIAVGFKVPKTAALGLYDLYITQSASESTIKLSNAVTIIENPAWVLTKSSSAQLVRSFALTPTPAHENLNIRYDLSQRASVRLTLYDVDGRAFSIISNAEQNAGVHSLDWNVAKLPNGVYNYFLSVSTESLTGKIVVEH